MFWPAAAGHDRRVDPGEIFLQTALFGALTAGWHELLSRYADAVQRYAEAVQPDADPVAPRSERENG